jgi:hypothetical protein
MESYEVEHCCKCHFPVIIYNGSDALEPADPILSRENGKNEWYHTFCFASKNTTKEAFDLLLQNNHEWKEFGFFVNYERKCPYYVYWPLGRQCKEFCAFMCQSVDRQCPCGYFKRYQGLPGEVNFEDSMISWKEELEYAPTMTQNLYNELYNDRKKAVQEFNEKIQWDITRLMLTEKDFDRKTIQSLKHVLHYNLPPNFELVNHWISGQFLDLGKSKTSNDQIIVLLKDLMNHIDKWEETTMEMFR